MGKPKIRFRGYTDDWEQRKLLSCIQSITDFRGRTPKKLGMDWSESGYLALSALNVKDGYIDFSQDVHYGNQELYDKWMSGKELHRGQVLFTTEAPMGNVAQVPDNKGYILSQRTIAFDVEEEILSENFLATLLRTPNVFNDLTALSSGGTAKGVSQKSLSGLDVVIPKNIDEQNKLADYFINLDHLITLHQRKCEETKKLKKYMLQKMFPRNGQVVPEIRFSGFTDDWEQRKVGDLVKDGIIDAPLDGNHGEKHPTASEYVDLGIPFLMASDVHNGIVNIKSCKFITSERAKRLDKGFTKNGDVLLTHKATIGESAILQGLETEYAVLTPQVTYYRIQDEERLSREYLYAFFNSVKFQNDLRTKAMQSTRPYIGISAQQDLDIVLPRKLMEQKKIGVYFFNLDHLITLHQNKCDELKKIKKFMLQNMFV